MTNEQVMQNFIDGKSYGHSSNNNLRIENNALVNYSTVIAYRVNSHKFEVNTLRYSVTTTKIQNKLRALIHMNDKEYIEINGQPRI